MKKLLLRLISILAYLCALMFVLKFDFKLLFNSRAFFLVLLGAFFLSLPAWQKQIPLKDMGEIIGRNALNASYMETFILLFVKMSQEIEINNIFREIALGCRPLLYGYILFVLLQTEEKEGKEEDRERQAPLTASELYYKLRELGLTQREAEVANHICKGMSNGEIAEELCISETTVKKHVSHIFEKLEISKREELRGKVK